MALTELQLPTKDEFYRVVQNISTEVKSRMLRWKEVSEFLADMGTADMDSMGIAAGAVRTDLAEFRTALDELMTLFEGSAVTPTNNPKEVMDKLRKIAIL